VKKWKYILVAALSFTLSIILFKTSQAHETAALFNIQMPGIIAAIAVTGLQKTGPSGPVSWVLVNAGVYWVVIIALLRFISKFRPKGISQNGN
jgi:hypothetical protein